MCSRLPQAPHLYSGLRLQRLKAYSVALHQTHKPRPYLELRRISRQCLANLRPKRRCLERQPRLRRLRHLDRRAKQHKHRCLVLRRQRLRRPFSAPKRLNRPCSVVRLRRVKPLCLGLRRKTRPPCSGPPLSLSPQCLVAPPSQLKHLCSEVTRKRRRRLYSVLRRLQLKHRYSELRRRRPRAVLCLEAVNLIYLQPQVSRLQALRLRPPAGIYLEGRRGLFSVAAVLMFSEAVQPLVSQILVRLRYSAVELRLEINPLRICGDPVTPLATLALAQLDLVNRQQHRARRYLGTVPVVASARLSPAKPSVAPNRLRHSVAPKLSLQFSDLRNSKRLPALVALLHSVLSQHSVSLLVLVLLRVVALGLSVDSTRARTADSERRLRSVLEACSAALRPSGTPPPGKCLGEWPVLYQVSGLHSRTRLSRI